MKKKLAILLTLICLLTLPGCRRAGQDASSGKKEPMTAEQMEEKLEMTTLRVLMDLQKSDVDSGQLTEALAGLPGYGTDFTIYVDFVPDGGADRSSMMTQIKTEILAGKGPDLFLCDQNMSAVTGVSYRVGGDTPTVEPFFTFPEKAMKNHLFLPLDEYIEKAEHMEWDKLLPIVMEAGKNEEGQQIIPLAYSFPVTAVEKDKYGLGGVQYPKTRMEQAKSGNAAIRAANSARLPNYIGRVMEPGADEPRFTEEELVEYMEADREMSKMASADYDILREDETAFKGGFFRTTIGFDPDETPLRMGLDSPEYSIIPARNVNGGVTADVTAFAAINRNAKYPDLAFKVIDYLMRTRNQQKSGFYSERLMLGMPVHMDVGQKEFPMDDGWYMNEANFKEFCAARDEITEARFPGPVDDAVQGIFWETPEELEKSVHEQYMLIKMLLAES